MIFSTCSSKYVINVINVVRRFSELSTGSVHCAPDEIVRPSEQTELYFAFVNLCCFLIIFLVSSLKYVCKIFNNYLTFRNKKES